MGLDCIDTTRTAKDHLQERKAGLALHCEDIELPVALTDAATPAKPKNGAYAVLEVMFNDEIELSVRCERSVRCRLGIAAYEDIVLST